MQGLGLSFAVFSRAYLIDSRSVVGDRGESSFQDNRIQSTDLAAEQDSFTSTLHRQPDGAITATNHQLRLSNAHPRLPAQPHNATKTRPSPLCGPTKPRLPSPGPNNRVLGTTALDTRGHASQDTIEQIIAVDERQRQRQEQQ